MLLSPWPWIRGQWGRGFLYSMLRDVVTNASVKYWKIPWRETEVIKKLTFVKFSKRRNYAPKSMTLTLGSVGAGILHIMLRNVVTNASVNYWKIPWRETEVIQNLPNGQFSKRGMLQSPWPWAWGQWGQGFCIECCGMLWQMHQWNIERFHEGKQKLFKIYLTVSFRYNKLKHIYDQYNCPRLSLHVFVCLCMSLCVFCSV
jgi:hypothetical protein